MPAHRAPPHGGRSIEEAVPSYLIPVRRKACTNWRWNTRNALRSGASDIIVAAEITEMSTPISGAQKIERPTVKGLVSGELVTMSGQRNEFQWGEESEKRRVGQGWGKT